MGIEIGAWAAASCPPGTAPGSWSREVIVVSNLGSVYKVRYYQGHDTGAWQRPAFFAKGEEIKWWIDKPEIE